jgi:hypothetical protein
MTTMTMDRSFRPAGAFERIWAVTRLNLANPWTAIILPWIILGIIFAANYAIWLIIARAIGETTVGPVSVNISYSGASLYIFVYMLVVAVQSMNLTFPFALGYGVTRRDFYLGSALAFVLVSAMFSIGMSLLSLLEQATNGWGVGGVMFRAAYFGDGPWFEHLWIFFTAFLFFFFVGALAASIFVRWKSNGIIAFFIGLAALVIGLAALFTFTETWGVVGGFFERVGLLGAYTWSLVPTLVAAIAGFLVLRRATPKS